MVKPTLNFTNIHCVVIIHKHAVSVWFSVFDIALVTPPVCIGVPASAMHLVPPKLAFIKVARSVSVLALAVAESIEHVPLVSTAIGPGVVSSASYLVLLEIAFVDRPIRPFERTTPVEESPPELSFVLMTVFELASSLPVVDVANLESNCE